MPRSSPRQRRQLTPRVFAVVRPAFRYSSARNAYVLRGVGRRYGPVIRPPGRPRGRNTPDGQGLGA